MPHGQRKPVRDPKKKRDRHLKRAAEQKGEATSRRERVRFSDGFIPRDENAIHLAQLPKAVTKHDVKAMLELAFGKVTHVHLDRNLKFGFARFEEERSKAAAIQMGTIDFLDERVEMRCGRKGRRNNSEAAPEPREQEADLSKESAEAGEEAGKETAEAPTNEKVQETPSSAAHSLDDTSQDDGPRCERPVPDNGVSDQNVENKLEESPSRSSLPTEAEKATDQKPTVQEDVPMQTEVQGSSDSAPMQTEMPASESSAAATETEIKVLEDSTAKETEQRELRDSIAETLEAIRRAAHDVLRVNGNKMTLSEMERHSNLGELKKDLPSASLIEIIKKLGRHFKVKEDGDGFQVAMAKVDLNPVADKVIDHFLRLADPSRSDEHRRSDKSSRRRLKNQKRDRGKLGLKDGSRKQKGGGKGGKKQQKRDKRRERKGKGKGRDRGDKQERGKGRRDGKRERREGRGQVHSEEAGARQDKQGKGAQKGKKGKGGRRERGRRDHRQGEGHPRSREVEESEGNRSNKRHAPEGEKASPSKEPSPRPMKRRVFTPDLVPDRERDAERLCGQQATYSSAVAIGPQPCHRQPGRGLLPPPPLPPALPPPPPLPPAPPSAPTPGLAVLPPPPGQLSGLPPAHLLAPRPPALAQVLAPPPGQLSAPPAQLPVPPPAQLPVPPQAQLPVPPPAQLPVPPPAPMLAPPPGQLSAPLRPVPPGQVLALPPAPPPGQLPTPPPPQLPSPAPAQSTVPPPPPRPPARPSGGRRPTVAPHLSTKTKAHPSPRPTSLPP